MAEFLVTLANIGFIPDLYGYFILSIFTIFIYQTQKIKKIDISAVKSVALWMTIIMGLFYCMQYPYYNDASIQACLVLYCLLPMLIFTAGYQVIHVNSDRPLSTYRHFIYAVIIGCTIHCLLNITVNINSDRSHTVDFFSGQLAATNLGTLNTLIFALLPAIIVEDNKLVRIVGIVCFSVSVCYAFILGTRTQIYLMAVVSAFSLFLYVFYKFRGSLSPRKIFKVIFCIALVVCISHYAYSRNIYDIKSKIFFSNLMFRYVSPTTIESDSYRAYLLQKGMADLVEYPLGGNNSVHYFHNYWLDIGRIGGIAAFVLAVISSLIFLLHAWRVFRNQKIDIATRFSILGMYMGVYLNYMMEPIMEGDVPLVYRFLLINGMVEAIYNLYYKRMPFTKRNLDSISIKKGQ